MPLSFLAFGQARRADTSNGERRHCRGTASFFFFFALYANAKRRMHGLRIARLEFDTNQNKHKKNEGKEREMEVLKKITTMNVNWSVLRPTN